jgi:hypothetical protein
MVLSTIIKYERLLMSEIIKLTVNFPYDIRDPNRKIEFEIPQVGEIPMIARQIQIDPEEHKEWLEATNQPASGIFIAGYPDYVNVKPILAEDKSSISVGNPKAHAGILIFWISGRSEWVVIYRQEFGSSAAPEYKFFGPFACDEFASGKIREAFSIKNKTILPCEILRMSPDELTYIAKHT